MVLGMHRSGTSALTGVCRLLGLELGGPLVPPSPGDNDRGFWERQDIVDLNEAVLKAFGLDHLSVGALPAGWQRSQSIAPQKDALRRILADALALGSFIGI